MKLWFVSLLTVLAFALGACGHIGTGHDGHDCKGDCKSSGHDCGGGKCEGGKCEDGKCDLKKKQECDKGKCDLKNKADCTDDCKGDCGGTCGKTDAAAPTPAKK